MAYKNALKQREFQRVWQAKQRAKYKIMVLEMFGGGCMMCGFNNILALQLDHIIPLRRGCDKSRGVDSGTALWRKVAVGILPKEDVQLLCANCHAIKTHADLYC